MELATILDWVTRYGGPALFALMMFGIVGLPIPDETLLVFSGYMIYRGSFHVPNIWLWAVCGSACGITLSFVIGRTVGLQLILRFGRLTRITPQRLDRIRQWFHGVGHWGLVLGYFVPGVRHATALLAGSSHLEWRIFALFAYAGAMLWVTTFLSIGYVLGERWEAASAQAHRWALIGGGVLVVAVGVGWLLRRRGRPPEDGASA